MFHMKHFRGIVAVSHSKAQMKFNGKCMVFYHKACKATGRVRYRGNYSKKNRLYIYFPF